MDTVPDEELIRRFLQHRDRDALRSLVCRYQGPIFGYLLQTLGDPYKAEEAAQEAFIRMLQGLPGYRLDLPFKPWLYRIALNTSRTLAQRQAAQDTRDRRVAESRREGDRTMNPSEVATQREILSLVSELPAPQREALVLHYFQGLSHSEVASVLELPAGTVATRIHGGLETLRGRLASLGMVIPAAGVGELLRGEALVEAPPSILSAVMSEAARTAVVSGAATALVQGGLIVSQVKFSTVALIGMLFLVGGSVAGYGLLSGRQRQEKLQPVVATQHVRSHSQTPQADPDSTVRPTPSAKSTAPDDNKVNPAPALNTAEEARKAKIRKLASFVAKMLKKSSEKGVTREAMERDPEIRKEISDLQSDPEIEAMNSQAECPVEILTAVYDELGCPLTKDQAATLEAIFKEQESLAARLKDQPLSPVDRMLLELQDSRATFGRIKGLVSEEQSEVFARINRLGTRCVNLVINFMSSKSTDAMVSEVLKSWSVNLVPLEEQERLQLTATAANYVERLQALYKSMETQHGSDFMRTVARMENFQFGTPAGQAGRRLESALDAYEQIMLLEKQQREAIAAQLPGKAETIRNANPIIMVITK